MLKRIRTDEVTLGMFLHKLEGSWLAHPFWKRKFLLDDPKQLENLKASAVEWVEIDISRGKDVGAPAELASVAAVQPAEAEEPRALEPAMGGRAAQIFDRAREAAAPRPDSATSTPAPAPIRFGSVARPIGSRAPIAGEMQAAGGIAQRAGRMMRTSFEQARLGKALNITSFEPMVDEVMGSIRRNPHAFNGVVKMMKTNDYLYRHSLSVCALMINLANELGLGPIRAKEAGLAGLLMDVGMMHVPSEMIERDGRLSEAEEEIVRSHTTLAHQFLDMGGEMPEAVLDVSLHHHERLDGSGYPHRLAGNEISQFARMAAICDVYDAMTSWRAHQAGQDPSVVLAYLEEEARGLDPEILEAFIRAVGIYPVGSLVRLSSNRLALVIDQNSRNPTLPWVVAFYDIAQGAKIKPENVDLAYRVGRETIISRENPANWAFDDWQEISQKLMAAATKE